MKSYRLICVHGEKRTLYFDVEGTHVLISSGSNPEARRGREFNEVERALLNEIKRLMEELDLEELGQR